ncbi:hypothetical protein L1987_53869 [Smallanthus sonchifolius]|uniref:Uncharacterized protein n=1 Tax=Smallanthus sonchifolius TaxID=185202 RepID=A0ACB9EXF6_9ASTR|nr:hypothetical protein L1987_53869 [Smallanthus sonchifolius]
MGFKTGRPRMTEGLPVVLPEGRDSGRPEGRTTKVETPISSSAGIVAGVSGCPLAPVVGDQINQAAVSSRSLMTSVSYADRCKGSSDSNGPKLQYVPPFISPEVTSNDSSPANPASQADTMTPSPAIPASAGPAAPGTSQASAGVKPIQRASISSGGVAKHGGNPTVSCPTGSGFNFARAVQGPKAKIFKPPVQDPSTKSQPLGPASRAANSHRAGLVSSMDVDLPPLQSSNRFAALNDIAELDPFDQSVGTGTNFVELDIRASINRTTLVEASSNQSRPDPMQEDGPPIGHANAVGSEQEGEEGIPRTEKLVCQLNREHIDGARFLPASTLSSPSPGGSHINGGGRTYGISESQRKAIADRLAVSNSICSEETVNWCPGEWDYFNDLCISLGLDPDYCIEDVESDTENGTAQFLSDLLNSGRPKSNRKSKFNDYGIMGVGFENPDWRLLCYFGCGNWTDLDMGQQKLIFDWLWAWSAKAIKPMGVLFWHFRIVVLAQMDSPRSGLIFIMEEAHVGVILGKPMAFFSALCEGPMLGFFDIKLLCCNFTILVAPELAQQRDVANEGGKNPGALAVPPVVVTEVLAPAPSATDHYEAPHPRKNPKSRRGSPYAKPVSSGPIRSSSTLAALDIPWTGTSSAAGLEFPHLSGVNRVLGEVHNREQSHTHEGPVEGGNSVQTMNWELDKQMDSSADCSPILQSVPNLAVQSVWNSPSSGGKQKNAAPAAKQMRAAPAADQKTAAHAADHLRAAPAAVQKKTAPAAAQLRAAPAAVQVSNPLCMGPGMVPGSTSYSPKNVSSGFNYSRAVQGGKGSPRQQPVPTSVVTKSMDSGVSTLPPARSAPSVGTTNLTNDKGFDKANRFSVLDIPSSIKFNKLITVQDDLYPSDHGLADSMDVEVNPLNSSGNYGITDGQKQVILNCMKDFKYVQAEAVEEWSQGEWDFFADKCLEMGLDPENSILYPYDDTEIEDFEDIDGLDPVHVVSHLKKMGSYVDPVVMKPPNRGITSPTKHPTDPSICVETFLPPDSGISSDDGGVARGNLEAQTSTLPTILENPTNFEVSIQGADPPLSRIGSSSRRFSPYGSTKGIGALRGKGKGFNRKEKGQNKYTPMISELRVNEFVQETSAIGDRRKGGDCSVAPGSNLPEKDATDAGLPNHTPVGEISVMDTEMEGLKQPSSPANIPVTETSYGMFSPRKDRNDIQSIFWDSNKGHYDLSGRIQENNSVTLEGDLNTKLDPHQMANSVWNSPGSGLESFADKIKKSSEITGPKGKQSGRDLHSNQVAYNPGVLKPPTVVSNATKKTATGFNFTRAVQGDKGGKKQQPLGAKSANPSKSIDINTANQFSVLDIPKSIKFNKLIEVQDDLYPPDHSLLDGMDVDMNRQMVGQKGDCQPSQKQVGDHPMGNENGVCHLNREHIEGVRVLPASVLSNPRLGGNPTSSSSLHCPGKSGKTYGISDEQKRVIADRLKISGSISMDIVDQWCPGQWDFFNDQCTLMGLDPNYCIEDVDSDTENGTSQFLSGLLNSGAPKPSRKAKPSSFLDGTLESAMRRYSLCSDAGAASATINNPKGKKSKTSKKEFPLNNKSDDLEDNEINPSLGNDVHGDDSNMNDVQVNNADLANHKLEDEYGTSQVHHRDLVVDTSMANPVRAVWEPENQQGTVDPSLNAQWELNLSVILGKATEMDANADRAMALYNLLRDPVVSMEYEVCENFFVEDNIMVALLHKWQALVTKNLLNMSEGSMLNDNVYDRGEDDNSETEEVEVLKKRRKKNRKGGGKRYKALVVKEGKQLDGKVDETNGGSNRKKYKIWSSKNRKPEKNIPIKKHVFKAGSIPPSKQLLGFPVFQLGTEGIRESISEKEKNKAQNRIPVGEFYKTAAAVEEKFSATVKNINTSQGNRKLLNSIKSLPSSKISKFSARMNEEGEVCIDDCMVEPEPVNKNENDEVRNSEDGIPQSLNEGWIKKQERNLNSRYASLVNQDQSICLPVLGELLRDKDISTWGDHFKADLMRIFSFCVILSRLYVNFLSEGYVCGGLGWNSLSYFWEFGGRGGTPCTLSTTKKSRGRSLKADELFGVHWVTSEAYNLEVGLLAEKAAHIGLRFVTCINAIQHHEGQGNFLYQTHLVRLPANERAPTGKGSFNLTCEGTRHWDKKAKLYLTWLAKNVARGRIQHKLYRRYWDLLCMVLNSKDPPDQATCVGSKCWNWRIDASSPASMIMTYEDLTKDYTNSKGMHTGERNGDQSYPPNGYVPSVPCAIEVLSEAQPRPATDGLGISTPPSIGVQREKPQNRSSPYDRGSSGGATRRKGLRSARRENPQSKYSPLLSDLRDADGFITVNRRGKNKPIKLQKKKKQVVIRTSSNGLNVNQRASISTRGVARQVGNPTVSCSTGSGFNFARAVQGPKAKIIKPPVQDPSIKSQPLGPASRAATSSQPSGSDPRAARRPPPSSGSAMEVDPPLVRSSNSIKRTNLVEATLDLYPHDPMNEDGPPPTQTQTAENDQAAGQCVTEIENLVCHLNREHTEGARLLPASILFSPSPGGVHTKGGGRTYGISESQRKTIADRLSISNSICSEETVNWCPGEWDYFNDLCISLGLDPDYCIEDVESDTENGTAQFFSELMKSGCPRTNRPRLDFIEEADCLSLGPL